MPSEPLIFVEVALTHGVPSSVQGLLAETRAPMAADQADTAVFYSISNCQSGLASISFGNSLIKQVAADLSLELPRLKTFVTLSPIPGLGHWAKGQGINLTDRTGDELKAIAAHYLIREKGRGDAPLDPVARFHLGNGAQVFQLHADADTSAKGQQQSAGVMVNYLYDLSKVAQRHEDFTAGTLAASKDIKTLADAARSLLPNEKV
jgi:malonyl-CoA decarboxylase